MVTKHYNIKKKQGGLALLILVIIIAMTLSSYYFSSISVTSIKLDSGAKTQAELKRAKQALLNYAVTNWRLASEGGKIGKLPCPDMAAADLTVEGSQNVPCGAAYENAVGFFPWRELGVAAPKDSSDNCFLYVVSPGYKVAPPQVVLNPDSYGQIQIVDSTGAVVQGMTPEDRPVAVILAPGKALSRPLPGQQRTYNVDSHCGLDYGNIAAYLDNNGITNNAAIGGNDTMNQLVSRYSGSENLATPLNDSLITITHKEIWDALNSYITSTAFDTRMDQLTEAIALCLAAYGVNNQYHLPMPAALDIATDYRNISDYDDSSIFTAGFSGRLPYMVAAANVVLITPTTSNNNNMLAENEACDDIDLSVGVYDDINFNGDAGADQGEFLNLWRNWQDHFFYAVSAAHVPAVGGGFAPACSGDCVRIGATEYAGIVFFAGLKNGQQRYTRPFDQALAVGGVDDKDKVVNYLENGNDAWFPDDVGNQVYSPVILPSNDIMFCITPTMAVNRC